MSCGRNHRLSLCYARETTIPFNHTKVVAMGLSVRGQTIQEKSLGPNKPNGNVMTPKLSMAQSGHKELLRYYPLNIACSPLM